MQAKFLSLVFIVLLLPSSLVATPIDDRVHTILLAPGVESVALPLDGWLVEAGMPYEATVAVQPQRGTWANEVYTPGPGFWAFGDSFALAIVQANSLDSSASQPEIIILAPAPAKEAYRVAETFEDTNGDLGGLDPNWLTTGDAPDLMLTSSTIEGAWGLRLHYDQSGPDPGVHRGSGVNRGNGTDQVGAEAEINLDPPEGPIAPWKVAHAVEADILTLQAEDSPPYVSVRLRHSGQSACLKAVINSNLTSCGSQCETPCQAIPYGAPHRLELWLGQEGVGHPDYTDGTIRLKVTSATSGYDMEERLPAFGLHRAALRDFSYGAFASPLPDPAGSNTVPAPVRFMLDNLEMSLHPLEDPENFNRHAADDFESGTFGASWIVDGPVELGNFERSVGSYQATVQDSGLADEDVPRAVLIDQSPIESLTVSSAFALDLRYNNLQEGQDMVVYSASSSDMATPESRLFAIRLRKQNQSLEMRAEVLTSIGTGSTTQWIPVPPDVISVGLRREASLGAPGELRLWVDGQEAVTGHWDSRRIESLLFGVQDYTPSRKNDRVLAGIGFDNLISTQ